MAVNKAAKSKKNRKVGRNADYCKSYKLSRRREHNKARRLRPHIVRHPLDLVAKAAVDRCVATIRGY
jgi:hypothetical protein